MSLPWVTLRRNGTTSAACSGPPNETSSSASYGAGSGGEDGPLVAADVGWLRDTAAILGSVRGPLALPRIAPMLDPYRRVLSRPGAALFSATGLVARMPISMMTLAIVLLVTAETGSYT